MIRSHRNLAVYVLNTLSFILYMELRQKFISYDIDIHISCCSPLTARSVSLPILLYVIKLLHGTAPAYLSELIAIHRPSRTLRSENSARINPPRIRTKTYGERRFDKSAATLWNNLPHEIRVLDSIDAFKSKLKTFFLYSV